MDVRHDDSVGHGSGAIHGIFFKTVDGLPLGLDTVCDPTNSYPDTTATGFDLGLGSLRIAFSESSSSPNFYFISITDSTGFELIANNHSSPDYYVEIFYDENKIRLLGTEI